MVATEDTVGIFSHVLVKCEQAFLHSVRINHPGCARISRECSEITGLLTQLFARDSLLFYRMIPTYIEVCKECMICCDHADDKIYEGCCEACSACINELRKIRK